MSEVLVLIDAVIREQAIAPMRRPVMSYEQAATALYTSRYTGPVLVHFSEGRPRLIEVLNPVTIQIEG